jgi:hypothetical protein
MKRIWLILALTLIVSTASMASAATYGMYENFLNRDGALTWLTDPTNGNPTPTFTVMNWSTTFSTAGLHNFGVYVDPEIDQVSNTFFNEYARTVGTADSRLSWQLDDPFFGTIWSNAQSNALDKSNAVATIAPGQNDVAMAMMWNFNLLQGETATVTFSIFDAKPTTAFYLEQIDPDSNASLYFSTTLNIQDGGTPSVPEPSTFILLGSALAGLALYRKRMGKSA